MQSIQALLLEPVGCLAEFPAAPFHEIATRFFGRKGKASASSSREYWHLVNLMEESASLEETQISAIEAIELEAVSTASVYEDVRPTLIELKSMGVQLALTTSLSRTAIEEFFHRHALREFFSCIASRDNTSGVKLIPLLLALDDLQISADHAIFLADTLEGIKIARASGVHPILMMNDPDEAQRLAAYHPDGGVVSLHEIPDFVRLVATRNGSV